MRILFIHQNFPGQFKYLAPAMAAVHGTEVVAMTMRHDLGTSWQGVRLVSYGVSRATAKDVHPWVGEFETKVIRGEACFWAALTLKQQGFTPDIIVAHPGWGESLFLKDVWPSARLGIYCEFFYHALGLDVGFDPEFPGVDGSTACRLHIKNTNNIMHLNIADAGLSPTKFQADTFPIFFRDRITVMHDGIDTSMLRPNADIAVVLQNQLRLTRANKVITFVNRNLEPYRGYHIFMRALPKILRCHPEALVLIVGNAGVGYGAAPSSSTWKDRFFEEVRDDLDLKRVFFLGRLHYEHYIGILQLSTVHVYLTYPFVLSWSLLEAMSIGCTVVGSDTSPVREVISHNRHGILVDFFDIDALSGTVSQLLDDPVKCQQLGQEAREQMIAHYDLHSICLPGQMAWIRELSTV